MQAMTTLRQGLTTGDEQAGFRRGVVGWIMAVVNGLSALNSTYVFLGTLKTGVVGWLMMNTCAPSIALFVAGFLLGSPVVMVAASVLMMRYGTGGLFVFDWRGYNLYAQAGHILMTLAVIYVLVDNVKHRRWQALALGAALGVAILVPLTILQTAWFNAHPGMLEMLFSGTYPMQ